MNGSWPQYQTQRQVMCWELFLAEERVMPTRDNWYQMQTTMKVDMVTNMFRKHPVSNFRLDDYRLDRAPTEEDGKEAQGENRPRKRGASHTNETPEEATLRLMQGRPHHLKMRQEALEKKAAEKERKTTL